MAACRYGIFLLVFNLISHLFTVLTCAYEVDHSKGNSISTRTNVLSSLNSTFSGRQYYYKEELKLSSSSSSFNPSII